MYLTAVDLSWEETVPARTLTRRKTGGETLAWSSCGSSGGQDPPWPRSMHGQGLGAHLACFWEHRQTQPWSRASAPSQMDTRTGDRYRGEDAGSRQESGEPPDTAVLWGAPPRAARACCPQGHCLKDPGAWAAFACSHLPPRCPRGRRRRRRQVSWRRGEDAGGRRAAR